MKRIGIVGCGIGGMGAAVALARDGHEVQVFERFAQPHPVGAGLLLQPSGLKALGALGLRDAVEAKGARVTALHGRTARGRTVLDLHYQHWRAGAYGLGRVEVCEQGMPFEGRVPTEIEVRPVSASFGVGAPWRFSSNDGRLEMTFEPILDRADASDLKIIRSITHQVFGRFSGTAVLDDGRKLAFKDLLGFAEQVENAW